MGRKVFFPNNVSHTPVYQPPLVTKVIWRTPPGDSSWWVSCLDNGPDDSSGTDLLSSLFEFLCLPLCLCALLGLWRWALDGLVALLWWDWEQPGQVINQVTPPDAVCLCLLCACRWDRNLQWLSLLKANSRHSRRKYISHTFHIWTGIKCTTLWKFLFPSVVRKVDLGNCI